VRFSNVLELGLLWCVIMLIFFGNFLDNDRLDLGIYRIHNGMMWGFHPNDLSFVPKLQVWNEDKILWGAFLLSLLLTCCDFTSMLAKLSCEWNAANTNGLFQQSHLDMGPIPNANTTLDVVVFNLGEEELEDLFLCLYDNNTHDVHRLWSHRRSFAPFQTMHRFQLCWWWPWFLNKIQVYNMVFENVEWLLLVLQT